MSKSPRRTLRTRLEDLRQAWRVSPARETLGRVDLASLPRRYLPILAWGRTYPREWLRADFIGGLTTWAVVIPAAMAYAQLAGVPSQYGLYAAMAAMAVYPLFTTSRHARVTMSSTMAVMSASIVLPLAANPGEVPFLTAALALLIGTLLIIAGALRLGFLGDFLSKPVITGFLFGLAINVIVGQLPKFFGVPAAEGNSLEQLVALIHQLPDTNIYTLAIGFGSALLIIRMRQTAPQVPASLIAVVFGMLLGGYLSLDVYRVDTVGAIPTGLPSLGVPRAGIGNLAFLLAGAGSMVFLALGESLAAARLYAARHRYRIEADKELIALGAANLASSFVGGVTVDASMSTSATSEAAGSKTQIASLITSGLTLLTILFLARLLENLPDAVLAAVLISSVIGLLNRSEMRRYLRGNRVDFAMAVAALVGVVLSNVAAGLMLAVFLSLGIVLWRTTRPRIAVLGRVRGSRSRFADLQRTRDVEAIPDLVILRLEVAVFYANANEIRRAIDAEVEKRGPLTKGILIDLGASAYLDMTSIDMLADLVRDFNSRGILVVFARVLGQVRDQLRQAGALDEFGRDNMAPNLAAGLKRFRAVQRALRDAARQGAGA